MRTLIRGGWVVGWGEGGHHVWRDGVCVVEDDRVLYVGRDYDGAVDATIDAAGKLVAPGFISTHLHAGLNAGDYVFLDQGRPETLARNYLNWQAGQRGKARYQPDFRHEVLFGLGQALRAGATTLVEIGCAGNPARFVECVDELGVRVYTGPSYRNVVMYSLPDGRLDYDWDDERGTRGLRAGLAFAEQYDGAAGGRVRAILCPGHPDTCADTLLAETAQQARQHSLPVTIHAAINVAEFYSTLERYRQTPIELLARCELLGPSVILGHAVFLAGHSWTPHPTAPDLALLGAHGATISHSPFKYLHMGVHLESLQRYVEAGVNVTIGTDFAPSDIVAEMRYTMLLSRVADRGFLSGTPRQVFDAATVNAARALGRDDLGRLAPGARADLVIWNMQQLHYGAVHDPIKSLVEYGRGADAELVMVDGRVVVRDGHLTTVDEAALLRAAQTEGERLWADVPSWSWGGRAIDQMVPPAYALD